MAEDYSSTLIYLLYDALLPKDDANYRPYSPRLIYTFNSTADTNTFCSKFNKDTNYANGGTKLATGNEIQINNDGYNQRWVIAGFDLEHDRVADDGTTYDNGFGIFLIPKIHIAQCGWNSSASGGYVNSQIHTFINGTVANNLKNVLGNHLINRRVLLSNSISGDSANSYAWSSAYCTLMSVGQITGEFTGHNTRYDDGEANYKLPVFNYMDRKTGNYYWTRGIAKSGYAWIVDKSGPIEHGSHFIYANLNVRPLIMIR